MRLTQLVVRLFIGLALLSLGWFAGRAAERRHFVSLRTRERAMRTLPTVTLEGPPTGWRVGDSALVTGSVVVSLDYYKRFAAGLKALFGGRIKAYEPLLERARREAILRMQESARARGFDAVFNVRLETSRLAASLSNGQGTAGTEILAFGTAVRRLDG